jgi:ribosome hibernation promoting factor
MKISVSGRHMKVGQSLEQHVETRVEDVIKKYLLGVTQVTVVFSKENHGFYKADITAHESTGLGLVNGSSDSDDVYTSFDSALIKLEKQLRKHRDKIKMHYKGHPKEGGGISLVKGTKYVIPSKEGLEEEEVAENDHPITIAEKATDIEYLSVSEAIMKMDLAALPALLFINSATGRLNVVYYRADGNISWVDPGDFAN